MTSRIEKNLLRSLLTFHREYLLQDLEQLRYYNVEEIEKDIHYRLACQMAESIMNKFPLEKTFNDDKSVTYSLVVPTVKLDKYHELMKQDQDSNGND